MEIASNIEATANQYRERFWTTQQRDDGVRALKYFAVYLSLVSPDLRSARFDVLHSAAIYCALGCPAKAHEMIDLLRSYGGGSEREIRIALARCS